MCLAHLSEFFFSLSLYPPSGLLNPLKCVIAQQALHKVNSIQSLAYPAQKFNGESEGRSKKKNRSVSPMKYGEK